MPIHWGSLADLDYTRYKGYLSSVFAGFFRQNVKVFCALWRRAEGGTIFWGRGAGCPPCKSLPLGGKVARMRRMRGKLPADSPSSVTCGDSFPQRGKPKPPNISLPFYIVGVVLPTVLWYTVCRFFAPFWRFILTGSGDIASYGFHQRRIGRGQSVLPRTYRRGDVSILHQ